MIEKKECSICGNIDITEIVSLGESPPANNFVNHADEIVESFPLILDYCKICACIQLRHCLSESELYSNYTYSTPNAVSLKNHYKDILKKLQDLDFVNNEKKCLEIGSNNGNLLKFLSPHFKKVLGIDPAENIAQIANNQGIETWVNFFSDDVSEKIIKKFDKFNVGIARHMFAHNNDPKKLMGAMSKVLDENGIFIIENAYAIDTFENGEFDQIYHEHMFYYSLTNINFLLKEFDFEVVDVMFSKVHGGSMAFICSKKGKLPISDAVKETADKEYLYFSGNKIFNDFLNKIHELKKEIKNLLLDASKNNLSVGSYGAPAKAFTMFSFLEIDRKDIKFCVDTTPTKIDKFFPNFGIPVISEESLKKEIYDILIINAWNYKDEIKAKSKTIFKKGTKLVFPIPYLEVFEV